MIITSIDLDDFAAMCNSTRRASFTITKNVRTGKWRVTIGGKPFIHKELFIAIEMAKQFLIDHTIEIKGPKRLINYATRL